MPHAKTLFLRVNPSAPHEFVEQVSSALILALLGSMCVVALIVTLGLAHAFGVEATHGNIAMVLLGVLAGSLYMINRLPVRLSEFMNGEALARSDAKHAHKH